MSRNTGTKMRWTPRNVPVWFVFTLLVVAGGGLVWKRALDPGDGGGFHPANATEAAEDEAVGGGENEPRVRPSPLAGGWYPANRDELHGQLRGFMDGADDYHGARPVALVCPHAGYRYSGAVAGWCYATLERERYDRIFILGPSHRVSLDGIGVGPWTHYETPLGQVPIDEAAVERLTADELFAVVDGVDADEHSVEMQVPFLQLAAMGSAIVPLVVGRLDRDQIGRAAEVLRAEVGPGDLVIASSDFTHYGPRFGYTPDVGDDRAVGIQELDGAAFTAFASGDLDTFLDHKRETGITVCGYLPMAIVQAMLTGDRSIELRRYDTSGNLTGDWKNSVSYAAIGVTGEPWSGRGADQSTWRLDRSEQLTLLSLARDAIAARLAGDPPPAFDDYAITEPMLQPAGGFVTLTLGGRLRGCIGEIPSTRPFHEVVRDHAVDAAFGDPRFGALTAAEFADVHVEISMLTPPAEVGGHGDIVLGRDGVYLIKGLRRAVYLPQVAVEQGWDLDQTLSSLARKAGMSPDGWRSGATFQTFQAQVFHE
jgi:MEMO1 family protein